MTSTAALAVTTWNIGAGPGKTADLDALAEASQVICCQEGGDRQPLLTGWAKRTGWSLFAGTTGGGPKVPILTAPGVRVVDARTVIAVGKFRVGDPGAGPAWLQRKAINVVTLAVDGGDELHVINTHMVASVTRSKLPNAWLRRRHYRRHMVALCRLIDSLDGPLVVCGDFNAERGFDLLAPLLDRVDLVPSGPTHGGRRIDLIGIRDLERDDDAVTRETSSDHRAVTATLTLPEVPTMPKPSKTITQRVIDRARALGAEVYTHDQWGAAYKSVYAARRRDRPVRVLQADTLVGHITVTEDDGVLTGDFFADMREVERIGYQRFGSGFSYNWGIDAQGMIGAGMPLDAKGTHTVNDKKVQGFSYDQNHAARAFAFIGVPGDKFTPAARRAWVILFAAMILEGALTEDPDHVPHSLFAAKDCPTDAVRDELPGMKREAKALVKFVREGGDPGAPETPTEPTRGAKVEETADHLRAAVKSLAKAKAQPGSVRDEAILNAASAINEALADTLAVPLLKPKARK